MEGLALGTINLLVLPILGGYWFQYKFVGTHYRAERLTPQRLVFHAAFYAIALVAVARGLLFAAGSQWKLKEFSVDLLMFSIIPAFIALVLLSLLIGGVTTYFPSIKKAPSDAPISNPSAKTSDQSRMASAEWVRLGFGVLVGGGLLMFVAIILPAFQHESPVATDEYGIFTLAALIGISGVHQRFLNRYMDFPFFGVALRIGLFGLIGSLAVVDFIFHYPSISAFWGQLVHVPGSGVPMLAFLLGLVLWWPLNLLYPYQAANMRLHERNGTTALDRLLYQASLELDLLILSMKDGKVYIGCIQELPPNPEDRNSYFEILPFQSGYRDNETREVVLTTFYESAYQDLVATEADAEKWSVFLRVLKIEDILSAGRFDPEAYVKFQQEKASRVPAPMEPLLQGDGAGI